MIAKTIGSWVKSNSSPYGGVYVRVVSMVRNGDDVKAQSNSFSESKADWGGKWKMKREWNNGDGESTASHRGEEKGKEASRELNERCKGERKKIKQERKEAWFQMRDGRERKKSLGRGDYRP